MKKILIIIGGLFGAFVLLIAIAVAVSPESFEEGVKEGKQAVEQTEKPVTTAAPTETMEPVKRAVEPPKQTAYTLSAAGQANGKTIRVRGVSNLPNKSLLDVVIYRGVVYKGETKTGYTVEGRGIGKASVFNGEFVTDISLNDSAFFSWLEAVGDEITSVSSTVQIVVTFNPKRSSPAQYAEVLKATGTKELQFKTTTNFPYNR